MPISLANLFRGLILALLAAHVFYMYCTARTMAETFGFDWSTALTSAVFGFIMLIPLVWAVTLPEFPEIFTYHIRARHRHARGRCIACGYQINTAASAEAPHASGADCPECGAPRRRPATYVLSGRTIRLFILINVFAWALGSAAGEAWMAYDEQRFLSEVETHAAKAPAVRYLRPRTWPGNTGSLVYEPGLGVYASR